MTLAALLEELREVDPGEWDNLTMWNVNKELPETSPLSMFIIQGCIQRACERRGWTWRVFKQAPDNEKSHCGEIGEIAPGYCGDCREQCHEYCIASIEADSPVEALLTAYIAAVKEEKR